MTLSAVCYAMGYGTGLAAFVWMARRRRMATEGIWILAWTGLIGGLVGANLAQWLGGGTTGKTVLGGIAGGYLSVAVAKKRLGIVRPTGDLFAVAVCAGEAVGRWGCFFGGCCYGKASDIPWHVWQHGAWRHPTQIYLSLASLLILPLLWTFARRSPPENGIFYLQGALYCLARFAVEFFRETPGTTLGLTAAPWACAAGLVFFSVQLKRLTARGLAPPRPSATPPHCVERGL